MLAAQCNKLSNKSPPPLADAAVGKGFHPWKKSPTSSLGQHSPTLASSNIGSAATQRSLSTTSSMGNLSTTRWVWGVPWERRGFWAICWSFKLTSRFRLLCPFSAVQWRPLVEQTQPYHTEMIYISRVPHHHPSVRIRTCIKVFCPKWRAHHWDRFTPGIQPMTGLSMLYQQLHTSPKG